MQGTWWCTNTRSPTAKGAPGPASTTSPAGSCPSTTGARGSWYQAMRSLPQSPQARTRTTSSPGPATGSGRSSSAIRPPPWYTAARTLPGYGRRAGEPRRHVRDPFALVARGVELGVGRVIGAAGPVGVPAGREDALVGVARRHDDAAPVVGGGVEGQEGQLLPAVGVLAAGEAREHLVGELALGPEAARLVHELLELGRDVAEAGRRAEDEGVGPLEVVERGDRVVLHLLPVRGPPLVLGDGLLRGQLLDVAQARLGPRAAGALLDRAGEPVHVPGGAVVDDRDLGHVASPVRTVPSPNTGTGIRKRPRSR